jgi:GMP synthase-like glutamine amidotransferase
MNQTVHIVNGNYEYRRMFESRGWTVTGVGLDGNPFRVGPVPTLVQFTGGEDVTPWLYGERAHRTTGYNFGRDIREIEIFGMALERQIPMAGICRGGQFLNVMCGGKMWQNVDHHAIGGTHGVRDTATGEVFQATSTHHQMMRPGRTAHIVGVADPSLSTKKESMVHENGFGRRDVEIVYYDQQNVLCFQPHPEFPGQNALADTYFEYIDQYLLNRDNY